MFEKKQGNKPLLALSSHRELTCHDTRTNIRRSVFWLFAMFAESQIKASERDPEYCRHGCETFLGNLQAADIKKDLNSFILCGHQPVCPGIMGNNSPVFLFSGTGLLSVYLSHAVIEQQGRHFDFETSSIEKETGGGRGFVWDKRYSVLKTFWPNFGSSADVNFRSGVE